LRSDSLIVSGSREFQPSSAKRTFSTAVLMQGRAGGPFIDTVDFADCRMGNLADGFLFFARLQSKASRTEDPKG